MNFLIICSWCNVYDVMLVGLGCYIKHFMLSILTHNLKVLNCVPCNIHVYGTQYNEILVRSYFQSDFKFVWFHNDLKPTLSIHRHEKHKVPKNGFAPFATHTWSLQLTFIICTHKNIFVFAYQWIYKTWYMNIWWNQCNMPKPFHYVIICK
jgi:hypothetical protein